MRASSCLWVNVQFVGICSNSSEQREEIVMWPSGFVLYVFEQKVKRMLLKGSFLRGGEKDLENTVQYISRKSSQV